MTPAAGAVAAALARLRAELAVDRAGMGKQVRELEELSSRWPEVSKDRHRVVVTAVCLHAWYTALESLLERVARAIDQLVPEGGRSHADLLSQLSVEVPGLRPAAVGANQVPELLELLKFRHFFRHAYFVELDPVQLRRHVDRLFAQWPAISESLERFDRFLLASLEAAAKS